MSVLMVPPTPVPGALPPTASPGPGGGNADPAADSGRFAAIFRQIAARQMGTEAPPAEIPALLLARNPTPGLAPEDLAAILPFLEGLGLLPGLAAPSARPAEPLVAAISAAPDSASGKGNGLPAPWAQVLAAADGEEGAGSLLAGVARPNTARPGEEALPPGMLLADKAFGNAVQSAIDKLANTLANASANTPAPAPLAGMNAPQGLAPGVTGTGSALPVAHPVNAPGWGQEIGQRVVWMANQQQSQAELVLTPPNMGRISVSLSMNGEQASAVFVSTNPAVREALEAALPRLRETLAEAGITLGQAQVGAEHTGGQRGESGREGRAPDTHRAGSAEDVASSARMSPETMPSALKSGRGLVDVFA